MMMFLFAILVFVSSAFIDFANTRYVQCVGQGHAHRAGLWSVTQWAASLVGFLIAFKVTLWMLPIEMVGLYVGTRVSLRARPSNLPVARVVS